MGDVLAIPVPKHKKPLRPLPVLSLAMRLAAEADLRRARFTVNKGDMKDAEEKPCLVLMNHSAFIDLEIASKILFPRPYGIVCTSDGFVGKEWLMRNLGCIPTNKFVSDLTLIRDIQYALREKRISVLMYPEASYSFDGCQTPLPEGFGRLLKRLGVPVVMIKTHGAFLRDPLYNCLQKRRVSVSADVYCLLSSRETEEKSVAEIDDTVREAFTFDGFAEQQEKNISVKEPFRADGLHRILYKCACCGCEGEMTGKGTVLTCKKCNKTYTLTEYGRLLSHNGETEFDHVPDWYAYQRKALRKEIEAGVYSMSCPVKILVLRDFRAVYRVGEGTLCHNGEGFTLRDEDGEIIYTQKPLSSYSLYSDYYWYELGDVICIGDRDTLYYCFPTDNTPVAKARLAAEEMYKLAKERKRAHVE